MKPAQFKIALDKYIEAIPDSSNDKGEFSLRNQIRADVKAFAELAMEGMLKEISVYGIQTHTYVQAEWFLREFRGKV